MSKFDRFSYIFQKYFIFVITYLFYASFHSSRAGWSYCIFSISKDKNLNFTDSNIATINLFFMIFYGMGTFFLGILGII